VTFDGVAGTVRQAGAFSIILKDDQGKTLVIPTKNIADRQIVIESGPSPDIQDDKLELKSTGTNYISKYKAQASGNA
jgi:hypothetical protein